MALVGRTAARASLRRWVADAVNGELRIVTVTGPAGIGKSRTIEWTTEQLRRSHGNSYVGRCSPELSHPFGPVATALAPLGARWPEARVVPGGTTFDATSTFGETELGHVRTLADALLREATRRPLMLVIEDLQWSNGTTLAAIEQLAYMLAASGGCRIVIALTHRPLDSEHPVEPALRRLAREPAHRSLELDPLDEAEVYELIRRLTSGPPDRRLVGRVHEASGGNPLVAIALTDDAISHPTRGAASGAGIPSTVPPNLTVDDVLARRFARLSATAAGVAVALGITGGQARVDDLAAICEATPDAVLDALDELERADLVRVGPHGYDLADPTMAVALLTSTTSRSRRGMHARLAARMQSRAPDGIELVELAHHLEQAGPGHAPELDAMALQAGDVAFAAGAWGQAAHLYEIALRGAPPSDDVGVAALEEKAGIVCFRDFDTQGCLGHFARAARLGEEGGDRELAARAHIWHLRRRFTSGSGAVAGPVDVTAVAALADSDLPAGLRARGHGLLAEVAFQANDLPRARHHAQEARELADAVGDDGVGFFVAVSEGLAALGVLDVATAVHAFEEADRCAGRSGQAFFRSGGTNRAATAELLGGDLGAADELAARAADDARTAGNWAEHALAHTVRTIVAALQGRFDDQEDQCELAQISCGRSAVTFAPLILHPAVAWARALRGDLAGAATALDELDAAGGRSARYRLAVELLAGSGQQVLKELDGHEWRPLPTSLTAYDAGAHAAELELAIHAGQRDRVAAGRRLFEDAHRRGVAFVLEWPCLVARLLAEAAVCLGESDAALAWRATAEQEAVAAGARVELARLAVVRADLLLATGDDRSLRAVELVDWATAEFDSLGLLRLAHRAQGLLDRPPRAVGAVRRVRPRAILFTDIVDSTAWNARLGDDHWLVLLAEHNRRARREVRRQRGVVVKTTGDGICAWFGSGIEAVDCALALQTSFVEFRDGHPETPISLRCGVAVGDVYDFDGDLAGLAVTEAARICGAAGADQVLTSAAVADGDTTPSRRYAPTGVHRLKGMPDDMPLFAVQVPWDTAADTTEGAPVVTQ